MPQDEDPLAFDAAQQATELATQQIILSASNHEFATLRALLRDSTSAAPANVADPENGFTPLHAAVASLGVHEPPAVNGHGEEADGDEEDDPESEQGRALKTVQLLLQNGAIWNSLDTADETPGCLAWRLGQKKIYEAIVDAGVRTELLFQRLDGYEKLDDASDDNDDDEEESGDANGESSDAVPTTRDPQPRGDESLGSRNYLSSRLTFTSDRLTDDSANAVMMDWETDIMKRTVDHIMPSEASDDDELTVLNIGFGMGIVDRFIQEHSPRPASHHIIEAHPAVAAKFNGPGGFREEFKDRSINLHEGRWQDVVPKLMEEGVTFDAIYFDTFAEDYGAFRTFFEEYVVALLKEGGKWSFFHGLGADRRVCYDVYTKVVEMDLFEAGYDIDWHKIAVPNLRSRGEWQGVRRSYFEVDDYRLPVCRFLA